MSNFSMMSNKQLLLAFENAVENLCIESAKYKKVRKKTEQYYKDCKEELLKRRVSMKKVVMRAAA